MSKALFDKNLKKWAVEAPSSARQLAGIKPKYHQFCKAENGQQNLQDTFHDKKTCLHAKESPSKEAEQWFEGLDLKYIDTLFVFGVGLGYGYQAAKEWLHADKMRNLVFVEDDLEVLHFLFQTELGQEVLKDTQVHILHIENDPSKGGMLFKNLIHTLFRHEMKVTALPYYEETRQQMFERVVTLLFLGKYRGLMQKNEYLGGGAGYFKNFFPNLLEVPDSYFGEQLYGKFKGVPAIICGAGPSIHKNVEVLKRLKDRALIFAGGTAVNVLNAYGIQPHFGAMIDPNEGQISRIAMNQAYDIPFFYCFRVLHEALKWIHGDHLYVELSPDYLVSKAFNEQFLDEQHPVFGGENVINTSISIAQAMGCDPLITVGVDLAYSENMPYGADIPHYPLHDRKKFMKTKGELDELIPMQDIYGEPIMTLNQWVVESLWYTRFAERHKDNLVINATEGGLGFKGVPNLKLEEVEAYYLKGQFDLETWIHGEIQSAKIEDVTPEAIHEWLLEIKSDWKACLEDCHELIELLEKVDAELKLDQTVNVKEVNALLKLIKENQAYTGFLKEFDEHYIDFVGEEIKELEFDTDQIESTERNLRIVMVNLKRLAFWNFVFISNFPRLEHAILLSKKGGKELHPALFDLPDIEAKGEKVETFYSSGKIKTEQYYVDGKLDGPSTFYHESGKVLGRSLYKNGRKEGTTCLLYLSGALKALHQYRRGKMEGVQEAYYEDGILKSRQSYVKGVLHGKTELFYPDEKTKLEVEFKEGMFHGNERRYHPSGLLKGEVEYSENHPIGTAKEWNEEGELVREIVYDQEGKASQIRNVNLEGKLIEEDVSDMQDDFDKAVVHTRQLTDSLTKIVDGAKSLSPDSDFDEVLVELENLKDLDNRLKEELIGDEAYPERMLWKSARAARMLKEQIDESTGDIHEQLEKVRDALDQVRRNKEDDR